MTPQYITINEFGDKHYYADREMKIRHRTDGPAVEWSSGSKMWYVDGKELSRAEFDALADPLELTLQDIASKFGVDVRQLKIKK